jgi:hypothetical protein
MTVTISLQSLTKGHGEELSNSLSKLVLGGILTPNEARASLGLIARDDGAELLRPVNMESVGQSEARAAAANAAKTVFPAPAAPQFEGLVALPRAFRRSQ